MNLNRLFPIWLHLILTGASVGLAYGLNQVDPIDPVKAYTATGLAVGLGVSALVRFLLELLD